MNPTSLSEWYTNFVATNAFCATNIPVWYTGVQTNSYRYATTETVAELRYDVEKDLQDVHKDLRNLRYDTVVAWCLICSMLIYLLWRTKK